MSRTAGSRMPHVVAGPGLLTTSRMAGTKPAIQCVMPHRRPRAFPCDHAALRDGPRPHLRHAITPVSGSLTTQSFGATSRSWVIGFDLLSLLCMKNLPVMPATSRDVARRIDVCAACCGLLHMGVRFIIREKNSGSHERALVHRRSVMHAYDFTIVAPQSKGSLAWAFALTRSVCT